MAEGSALNGTSISTPKDSANIAEEQVKRLEETKDEGEQHDTLSSGHEMVSALMNSLHKTCTRSGQSAFLHWWGGTHAAPPLAVKLSA